MRLLADLVDEVGAANDDPLAFASTPAATITRVASNGSVRTGRGSNRSGSTCSQTIASPLLLRTTASRGTIRPVTGTPLVAITVTGWPMLRLAGGFGDGELHDRGVLLQRAAEALETSAPSSGRRSSTAVASASEAGSISPYTSASTQSPCGSTIWNRTSCACTTWPGTTLADGDHAVGRRAQQLGLGASVADRLAGARRKPSSSVSASVTWLLRHRAAFGERAQSSHLVSATAISCSISPVFSGDRRAVGEREIRIDLGQNIALAGPVGRCAAARLPAESRGRPGCSARRWSGSDRRSRGRSG